MELPRHLIAAIESAHVAFEGLSHPLRLVGADRRATGVITLSVETTHNGEPHRAEADVAEADLEDEKVVTATLADAMRATLAR